GPALSAAHDRAGNRRSHRAKYSHVVQGVAAHPATTVGVHQRRPGGGGDDMTEDREHQSADAELEGLLSRLCDGTLAAQERRGLGERMATDAAARRLSLEYLDLHAALGGPGAAAALPDLSRVESLSIVAGNAGRHPRLRRWMRWSAAAGMVIILGAA